MFISLTPFFLDFLQILLSSINLFLRLDKVQLSRFQVDLASWGGYQGSQGSQAEPYTQKGPQVCLMFWSHHLEMLNTVIFDFVFFKWSSVGQWAWSLGSLLIPPHNASREQIFCHIPTLLPPGTQDPTWPPPPCFYLVTTANPIYWHSGPQPAFPSWPSPSSCCCSSLSKGLCTVTVSGQAMVATMFIRWVTWQEWASYSLAFSTECVLVQR